LHLELSFGDYALLLEGSQFLQLSHLFRGEPCIRSSLGGGLLLDDGRVAVWLPVPPGFQETLIASAPAVYFRPPYVGHRGWVGIDLDLVSDEDLAFHVRTAWELIAPKRLLTNTP
jgi:hypothetical protein